MFFNREYEIWPLSLWSSKIKDLSGDNSDFDWELAGLKIYQIIKTEIIKYREPYGGEISGKNWLKQFEKKSSNSKFRVGYEIDGISGATMSVHSISKGIKKLAILFPHIRITE